MSGVKSQSSGDANNGSSPAAPGRDSHVKALSGKTLNMKFMQRSKEASIRSQLEQDSKRRESEAQWSIDIDSYLKDAAAKRRATASVNGGGSGQRKSGGVTRFVEEPSFLKFEGAALGRKSFQDFNKAIQGLNPTQERLGVMESTSVSDAEMAKHALAMSIQRGGQLGTLKGKRKRGEETPDAGATADEGATEATHFSSERFKFLKPAE
ncbi:hypothetical protein DFJ73DRAFT_213277 [Zopfochytrium polystomum]|nr:hypothetical protein DFJ73DRAFT_213277 [Zopfochytrium polystomum]